MAWRSKDNGLLLLELVCRHGAAGAGNIAGFFDVDPDWCCSSCGRSKVETARRDRNGSLLCAFPRHHDHFSDFAHARLRAAGGTGLGSEVFQRFSEVYICNDCNVADSAAKRIAGAPDSFSFAPFEIGHFVIPRQNKAHEISEAAVKEAYEAAQPSMKLIATRLRKAISELGVA
jgi:hypothetical protein